jgi:hypothetical protein
MNSNMKSLIHELVEVLEAATAMGLKVCFSKEDNPAAENGFNHRIAVQRESCLIPGITATVTTENHFDYIQVEDDHIIWMIRTLVKEHQENGQRTEGSTGSNRVSGSPPANNEGQS